MQTKTKIIIFITALLISFAAGYALTPTKTVIKTQIVEVEKKSTDNSTDVGKDVKKTTTTKEVTKPDGTKETTTTVTEETKTDKKTDQSETDTDSKTETSSKEIERLSSRTNLSLLTGADIHNALSPIYGASVSKQILGPISLGVFGLQNGIFGVSIGLSL